MCHLGEIAVHMPALEISHQLIVPTVELEELS